MANATFKSFRNLTVLLALSGIVGIKAGFAVQPVASGKGTDAPQATKTNEAPQGLAKLSQCLAAYKANNDPVTWDAFWKEYKQLLQADISRQADLITALKVMPGLSDIGLRITEVPGLKIFSFTRVPEAQQILVAWKESGATTPAVRKGRKIIKPAVVAQVTKMQALSCSSAVLVNDGRVLCGNTSESAATGHASNQKYLVLCGSDKKTGLSWLQGYRLAEGHWVTSPDLFSGVPPYLLQNVQGKPSFSGSSLIFTSESAKPSDAATSDNNAQSASSYKIVLRFFGDHYAFDTKSSLDAAMAVALQFSQAIQKGREDLVRAWLVDAKLASIPGYLGLYNRSPNAPAFRLIAMTPPLNGSSRFRLITYEKDDLILDIGRVKAQWAVKGIFIAPPDAFAKKLMSQVAAPTVKTDEPKPGEPGKEN